jgi:alpha-1,2-mannosyltransferase
MAVRISLANRLPIMDCDETFNYWEPVHFLLYRTGFQTWEYSNEFALRTYAYLYPMVGLAKVYQVLLNCGGGHASLAWLWPLLSQQQVQHDKMALFLLVRASLGAWTAWTEVSFCRAVAECGTAEKNNKINQQSTVLSTPGSFLLVALTTEGLLLTSAGMGHASSALLPSSTLMGLWLLAAASYLRQQHTLFVVLAVTATLAVGWPFGVVLFVPLGWGVLMREYNDPQSSILTLLVRIGFITAVIQGVVMVIDYQHYGRVVAPVWNILIYNTASGGDELYGVEPLSYYVKNLVLNLNYVAIAGIGAGLFVPLLLRWTDGVILTLPMYLWLSIVAPRPHKEERFLFPIYPVICLGAAMMSVSLVLLLLRWWSSRTSKEGKQQVILPSALLLLILWVPAALLSASRLAALSKYYAAPLSVYAELPRAIRQISEAPETPNVVCTCGEWYRFPSSFYIPEKFSEFGFAPSTFGGQLPQPFTVHGSGPESSAMTKFNDRNEPEKRSYTALEDCDFLVELSTSFDSCAEHSEQEEYEWEHILKAPFLNADATSSAIHRIVYIPRIHEEKMKEGKIQYGDFALYFRSKRITGTEA